MTHAQASGTQPRPGYFVGNVLSFFEGIEGAGSPAQDAAATIRHTAIGLGNLLEIRSPSRTLKRRQPACEDSTARTFSIVLILEGAAEISQAGRACSLPGGCFALVDGKQPFEAEMPSNHHKVLFQLPRQPVVSRYPGIEGRTSLPADMTKPGNKLFREFVRTAADSAHRLSDLGRYSLLAASIEMLGLIETESAGAVRVPRIERAIAEIELNLADPELCATRVAARLGLSRRRLDAIFEHTGMSVSAQIWERRLLRAASMLGEARDAWLRVIDVAYACGFSDAAHFSRAFRKRFGLAPREWRHRDGFGPNARGSEARPRAAPAASAEQCR